MKFQSQIGSEYAFLSREVRLRTETYANVRKRTLSKETYRKLTVTYGNVQLLRLKVPAARVVGKQ